MDLGATICSPKRPKCMMCPAKDRLRGPCRRRSRAFPVKASRRKNRRGAARPSSPCAADGAVLLPSAPRQGCWAAWPRYPGHRLDRAARRRDRSRRQAPFAADWRFSGQIVHVFTHFSLTLDVFRAEVDGRARMPEAWWSTPDLPFEALPTVMKKAIEAALPGATKRKIPYARRHMAEIKPHRLRHRHGADPLRSRTCPSAA
jgi:A/G-specific adenine glycosylase